MIYYAGIGSRNTPQQVLNLFSRLGSELNALYGFVLRSGAADGADSAFERGVDVVGGEKEIFLPWAGFNGSDSGLVVRDRKAFEIAQKFHPHWYNLKPGVQKLHARNTCQILGWDMDTPSSFVLCYTEGGRGGGGTGQALKIARYYGIRIFDAGSYQKPLDFYSEVISYSEKLAKAA